MTSPYTTQPLEAYMAAQTSAGLVLGAVVWSRVRPWLAAMILLVAVALAVVAPVAGDFMAGIGLTVDADPLPDLLKLAAGVAVLAAIAGGRVVPVLTAALGEVALWRLTDYLTASERELSALHLAFFGLLAGVLLRTQRAPLQAAPSSAADGRGAYWVDDAAAFVLGTGAGALVCRLVLHGWTNSGDEWANTFQAALFAKLRAYGAVPHCAEAFRAFWVYQHMGRSFAQYTPGWPLFMAPFVAARAVWLAGPASLGLLAAGVGRLARRAASGASPGDPAPSPAHVRAAGWFAVAAILLSASMLINGGSRYPHVFVATTYVWAVESLMRIADGEPRAPGRRDRVAWGAVLGASVGLLVAARPGDGCTLAVGLFLYFVYALARRRPPWRAVAAAAAVFAVVGGVSLVVLRLQLGRWFATGYSLLAETYPWMDPKWSLPQPNEYKWAIPLATGAYCWWPCSPAVGLAGIASLRGRAQRIGFVFFFSYVPFLALYTLLSFGRGFDLGYGPRYTLPTVVPMAIGTGVALARVWVVARARWIEAPAIRAGGPAAVALTAIGLGVVRIAPLVYPVTYADVQLHNRLHEALAPLRLRNAVVFAGAGLNNTDPADLPENLPLELYPDQDVLIAVDRGPEVTRCVREQFPNRSFFRALPGPRVQIVPF